MSLLRRRFIATALAGAVVGARTLLADPAPRPTPRTFNQYDFPLEPGATLSITVGFNAQVENAISFWDRRVGGPEDRFEKWPGCGNFDPVHKHNFEYTNEGAATIPFALNAGYKTTRPNPNAPWNFSSGIVKAYHEKEIVIGYPNSLVRGSSDTNTQVTITISRGVLPDPRVP